MGERDRVSMAADLLEWYSGAARDLPWRRPEAGPWGVLVSEIMLQQTPVARVLPAYIAWLQRWPTPAALAADSRGEAVRMWGRLGYPRRALRLHECAVVLVLRFGGHVPAEVADLIALPGVGPYTARAVATFAHGRRHAVVDTNVRRVAARLAGVALPRTAAADLALVEPLVPAEPATARVFAAAAMELGALICHAGSPRCELCPIAGACAWRQAGGAGPAQSRPRPQGYAGTDRQVRGLLLAVLRDTDGPVQPAALVAQWSDKVQRDRALRSLTTDGLVERRADETYRLP